MYACIYVNVGTVAAYGQTGSGKTFTMTGPDLPDPSAPGGLRHEDGFVQIAVQYLFERIACLQVAFFSDFLFIRFSPKFLLSLFSRASVSNLQSCVLE